MNEAWIIEDAKTRLALGQPIDAEALIAVAERVIKLRKELADATDRIESDADELNNRRNVAEELVEILRERGIELSKREASYVDEVKAMR